MHLRLRGSPAARATCLSCRGGVLLALWDGPVCTTGSSRLLLDKAAFRIAFALKTRVKMSRAEAGAALAGPQVGSEANDRIDSRLPPGSRGEECGRVAHRCPIIGAKPVINLRHDG